jgi:N utilization substance protein A
MDNKLETLEIISANQDVASVITRKGEKGYLPKTEFYLNQNFNQGDIVIAQRISMDPKPIFSTNRPEFIKLILPAYIPELRDGTIKIMGLARLPGVRSKIALATTDPEIDPIGAAVGKGQNRVKAVSKAARGERLDFIAWHPDLRIYLANSIAPAAATKVIIDGKNATIFTLKHQMSAAVGAGGLNSQLAGQLTGMKVRVTTDEEEFQVK